MSSQDLANFIYIEGGRNLPEGKFTRNEMMTTDQVRQYRIKNGNVGLYVTAYRYDSLDVKEANLYGDFYLDFDAEDFEKVRADALHAIFYLERPFLYNINPKYLRIYYSGKKGVHILVPAETMGIEPHKDLNCFFRLMAESIHEVLEYKTLDLKIYDRRRLFRLPNSRHADTGLFKVPLTYEELKNLSLHEIQKKASEPYAVKWEEPYEISRAKSEYLTYIDKWDKRFGQKFSGKSNLKEKPIDFIPACIQQIMDEGPKKGERNNTAAALTSFFKRYGDTDDKIWQRLVEWNRGSLTERELKACMKSVFEGNYEYGCSTFEKIATCIRHECKLWKGKQI